ncbi:MAG: hypothetical protein GTN76_06085 [Candidatus Aenigmarchaeota archaeon]|nr:hypothetical protein [Candidatus Aenigmarchaeota archaeon]
MVRDNAPHRLADKIALLLSTSNGKLESPQSIRASVTEFSWSNIADVIVNEYREVLRNYLPEFAVGNGRNVYV